MPRASLVCVSIFACTLACNADTGGLGSAGDDGTATDTGTSTGGNETSDTASSGDGDGDGDPTTTGDGDGDGDGDPTGDGDGDPTGDGDGDGDPVPEYYGECPFNQDDECEAGEYCLDQVEGWQVCTTSCNATEDCPPPPQGANVQCVAINANLLNKGCFLSCEGNNQCPQGMVCETENLGIDKICVFNV